MNVFMLSVTSYGKLNGSKGIFSQLNENLQV
jgi:hypothetical protein